MIERWRKPAFLPVALSLILATLLASPTVKFALAQGDASPAATVRFVHVYSGGGPVDIYVDNNLAVRQLAFGTATEYATMPDGDRHIQVVATGEDPSAALIDTTISVDNGSAYNILIGGQQDQLDARSYEVNLDDIDPGRARIRFIQAAPDTGNVDIELAALSNIEEPATVGNGTGNGTTGFSPVSGLGFNDSSDYQTVIAGTYDIVVRGTDNDEELVRAPSIDLTSGNVYDVVVLGQLSSNNLTLLPLITPVGKPCGEVFGIGQATSACARFIHTSPDAGELDIYVNGTRVVTAISYGTVTQFTTLGTDEQRIQIVPAGQPVANAWLDEKVDPDAGRAYQFSILGIAQQDDNNDNDFRLHQDQLDLTSLPPGQARVRMIHAVPDAGEVSPTLTGGADVFDNVSFDDATHYATVDAGTYDLAVTGDNDQILVTGSGVEFKEGTVYDVFVIGLVGDQSVQLLIATAPAEVRMGAQGTPLAVSEGQATTGPGTAVAAPATAVGGEAGGQPTPTTVGAAPVTPVLTPEPSPTS
jgi:hypothetical protein